MRQNNPSNPALTPAPCSGLEQIFDNLKQWSIQWVNAATHTTFNGEPAFKLLSGDAGFRRYFRVNTKPELLAVHAPVDTENSLAFRQIGNVFLENGVRAPNVLAADFDRGFLLVEDLGQELLDQHICDQRVDTVFANAVDVLLRLQQCDSNPAIFPAYDARKLRDEMSLFVEWFVDRELRVTLSSSDQHVLDALFDYLVENAESQPQVVVHRDFHSKNLVYADDGNYGVIDFQDAVIGPVTYDLVSLFRDRYHTWPDEKIEAWVRAYTKLAIAKGLLPEVEHAQVMRWFDLMGLQRHIKVLGIFCRLALRDNKPGYMRLLPIMLGYTRATLAKYPELKTCSRWFEATLMPRINKQAWMTAVREHISAPSDSVK